LIANPKNGVVWSKEEQASKLGAVAEVIVSLPYPATLDMSLPLPEDREAAGGGGSKR
jgi:hypothetical protein